MFNSLSKNAQHVKGEPSGWKKAAIVISTLLGVIQKHSECLNKFIIVNDTLSWMEPKYTPSCSEHTYPIVLPFLKQFFFWECL